MKTTLGHIEFKIDASNKPFYADLMAFLGWTTLHDGDGFLGFGCEGGASLWFVEGAKAVVNDYDGPGVNHVAISAPSQDDVDTTVGYLHDQGIGVLFDTPRHRPEFSSEGTTYYQVMFASPDRILFEVVYTGPK